MKLQVVLRSFGAPVLLAIIRIIRLGMGHTPFRVFTETLVVVSIAISRLLSDDRYVQTLEIRDGRIAITYVTKFLQVKSWLLRILQK